VNRFPVWKNALIALAIALAFLYTLPNFFGESPAVQVSSAKATAKVDAALMQRVEGVLKEAAVPYSGLLLDPNSVRVRFADTDIQLKARDLVERRLNPDPSNPTYVVALNLLSSSPSWLTAIRALPMYLGLDLRGGVHFLLQVDMPAAHTKRLESLSGDIRSHLRDKNVRHAGIQREGQTLRVRFRDRAARDKARETLASNFQDLALAERGDGEELLLVASLTLEALKRTQEYALKQNITTLHNRINELGVAEPIIQQQGADRVVVQLPGVQDTAKAKDILGRTASLEVRMVDEEKMTPDLLAAAARGEVPFGTEFYVERNGQPLLVNLDTTATGPDSKSRLDWYAKQFDKLGVQLAIRATDYNRFQDKLRKGNVQLYFLGWNADYPDPENFLFLLHGAQSKVKTSGENASNYENPEFDRLFERVKNMYNGPERQALIDRMVEIARYDAPWVWSLFPKDYTLHHAWVHNRKPNQMANNSLKYQRLDPALREKLQREWNQPVWWPVVVAIALLALSLLPAVVTFRRRERATAGAGDGAGAER